MSIIKKITTGAAALAITSSLAAVTTGTASAGTNGEWNCYFHRGSDRVVTAGALHVGLASGNCSHVTFGAGFPGSNGQTGTIGLGHVRLPNGEWAVAELEDVFGIAPALAAPGHNMPF